MYVRQDEVEVLLLHTAVETGNFFQLTFQVDDVCRRAELVDMNIRLRSHVTPGQDFEVVPAPEAPNPALSLRKINPRLP